MLDFLIKPISTGYTTMGYRMGIKLIRIRYRSLLDPKINNIKVMTYDLETLVLWISKSILNLLFLFNLYLMSRKVYEIKPIWLSFVKTSQSTAGKPANQQPVNFAHNQSEKSYRFKTSRDIQKRRLSRKSKVSTMDIEIKLTG